MIKVDFTSEGELERWLNWRGIDAVSWSSANAKTISNLWHEYKQGEIAFRDDPPRREVRVVQIILRQDGYCLLELAQAFRDGSLRRRERPPSEKIVAGESPLAAAERGLREELGLEPRQIKRLSHTGDPVEHTAESPSYPGLPTHYIIYAVEAITDGLPQSDFWRENKAALEGDPVQRHLWGWRRGF